MYISAVNSTVSGKFIKNDEMDFRLFVCKKKLM